MKEESLLMRKIWDKRKKNKQHNKQQTNTTIKLTLAHDRAFSFYNFYMTIYHLRHLINRRQRCKCRQKKAPHYLVRALNS